MNHYAIYALYPHVVRISDAGVFDKDNHTVVIDITAVNAWVDPNAYRTLRAAAYPPIGDQLDDLFRHGAFSPEMAAQLQAVKARFPK